MAMIIPGTYIEVRAEGLIRPGPVAVGNIGIVGTARRGELDRPYLLSGLGQARDIFGEADSLKQKDEDIKELTLIRALEVAYRNGARNVSAVRVADTATAEFAEYELAAGGPDLVLRSRAPGKGYNTGTFKIDDAGIVAGNQRLNVTFTLDGRIEESWQDVPAEVNEFAQVINGDHPSYDYASNSTAGGGSALFEVDVPAGAAGEVQKDQAFGDDKLLNEGSNGATSNSDIYARGLEALLTENVQIVVLAGEGGALMAAKLSGHVETASADLMKQERIGIIGSTGPRELVPVSGSGRDDGRMIFVSPGIQGSDNGQPVTLPGTYTAAAVAGRISSLDPHVSPTNKTISESGLQTRFNGNELENGLRKGVLLLEQRNGSIRIVRGLTTSSGAWQQITTRRIVDYARKGTRSAADPFIGKLNNERVRQELKASINSLLADMLDREMLTGYELDVSATRDQEIQGIAMVTMMLMPTFSIDFIRVVMYLK